MKPWACNASCYTVHQSWMEVIISILSMSGSYRRNWHWLSSDIVWYCMVEGAIYIYNLLFCFLKKPTELYYQKAAVSLPKPCNAGNKKNGVGWQPSNSPRLDESMFWLNIRQHSTVFWKLNGELYGETDPLPKHYSKTTQHTMASCIPKTHIIYEELRYFLMYNH